MASMIARKNGHPDPMPSIPESKNGRPDPTPSIPSGRNGHHESTTYIKKDTILTDHVKLINKIILEERYEPKTGLEPVTHALRMRCSTN